MLQTCTGPTQKVVFVMSLPVICASGKGNRRTSKLCHRFVKRVAEVNFVTSLCVAHVLKSHALIFGGS